MKNLTIEKVAEMYNINLTPKPCVNCDKLFEYTEVIHLEKNGMIGVKHPLHSCGKQYQRTVFVPCTEASKEEWSGLTKGLLDKFKDQKTTTTQE